MTKTNAVPVSSVLLLVVGLLAGFIGGYAIARQGAPATPVSYNFGSSTSDCQHELDPADQSILEGFICPAPQCADALLTCHCETAHQIKDQVKDLLRQGNTDEEIRREIKEQYNL